MKYETFYELKNLEILQVGDYIYNSQYVHCYFLFLSIYLIPKGLPWWLSGKESDCNAGDTLGLGLSPGEGNGNPLQYSCLENPMDRGP